MHEVPEQVAIPDTKPDEPESGLMCFLSPERECGPECMAFTPQPADVAALAPQQRHCIVLVSGERLARHAAIGVKVVNDIFSFFKTVSADQQRTGQKPPQVGG